MALSTAARRAIAIRNKIAKKARAQAPAAANDNQRGMSKSMLAACVDAGGFDQNAAYA